MKIFFWIVVFLFFPCHFLLAYQDDVGVRFEEAWAAAKKSLQTYGLRKENINKKEMETDWKEDHVVRSGGLLKKIASKVYRRRVRFKLHFQEVSPLLTGLEIQGVFEERPIEDSPALMWQKVKPRTEDLELEVQLFYRILNQLTADKKGL